MTNPKKNNEKIVTEKKPEVKHEKTRDSELGIQKKSFEFISTEYKEFIANFDSLKNLYKDTKILETSLKENIEKCELLYIDMIKLNNKLIVCKDAVSTEDKKQRLDLLELQHQFRELNSCIKWINVLSFVNILFCIWHLVCFFKG
jgi:membrane-associated HD superfamily phosphohydrolase